MRTITFIPAAEFFWFPLEVHRDSLLGLQTAVSWHMSCHWDIVTRCLWTFHRGQLQTGTCRWSSQLLFVTLKHNKLLQATARIVAAIQVYDHTHTHPFNGPLSGTTRVSRYQKGKTNLDFTGARDSEWQWHQWDEFTLEVPIGITV